ncbi:MAG: hypothetical protein RIN55_11335 [Tissierellaceae bacterium]|nr:hypothetical protein [Tissierellaceae bacterium]
MKNNENNIKKIADWLEKVCFRKNFFGGVDEQDVWKKIDELNSMYEAALEAERVRYNTLIECYKQTGIDGQDGEMAYDEQNR